MRFRKIVGRLARTARRLLHQTEPDPEQTSNRHGVRLVQSNGLLFLLDPNSVIVDQSIITTGNWEAEQQRFLIGTARSLISQLACETVFMDIGAYLGLYALRMARSALFDRIIAIEGDRRNYAQLRANVFINALDRKIDCFEVAVSDHAWDMHFLHSEANPEGNRGGVGHIEHNLHLTEKKRTVTVDELVSASGALIVAKIDVEGHELRVIRGMRRLIEDNRILLQVECLESAMQSHEQFLPSLGLRRINRISIDSYWTNIPGLSGPTSAV